MNDKVSVCLDIIRFAAAMVVFIGHASNGHISGGLFWQIYPYLQPAVVVFFVLSGYVIAYVTASSSRGAFPYARDRIARIHSVLLPALLLTVVCDLIGHGANPRHYEQLQPILRDQQWLRYLLSVFVVQNVWNIDMYPGTNGPTWSLTYEVFYYAIWACVIWTRGLPRAALLALLLLIAGPSVASLLPIWLLGVLAYRVNAKQLAGDRRLPWAWLAGMLLLAALLVVEPWVRNEWTIRAPFIRSEIVADYFCALVFFLLLVLLPSIVQGLEMKDRQVRAIRYIAQSTFVIYLFHYPLIRMFSGLRPGNAAAPLNWLLVFPVSFLIMLACVPLTNHLQRQIKRLLDSWWARSSPRPDNKVLTARGQ